MCNYPGAAAFAASVLPRFFPSDEGRLFCRPLGWQKIILNRGFEIKLVDSSVVQV